MTQPSNKLSQFWQELKRRKVMRVITVYAGAAFVILELIDIVSPSLRLPEWTMNFMIVLLCAGFIIAVILSWIYDIHPEGGIVKTEPAHQVKSEEIPKSSSGWKIASYISFVVIIGLVVFNIITTTKKSFESVISDKSIAVRPFTSLSDDSDKQYLADGVMEAILLHLSKIEDLKVMSRTSVEQYRKTEKTAITIGQELDVSYLLEGSFQKYGDEATLIVQLIDTNDDTHVWSNEYNRDWSDIFSVQSEVAKAIASELQAIITPQEKAIIERTPTNSLVAFDYYLRAIEEHNRYDDYLTLDYKERLESLDRAILLYQLALEYDPLYAKVYAGLARAYSDRNYYVEYFNEDFIDSTLTLANLALSLDPNLEEAHLIKGNYYYVNGSYNEALKEFELAIDINPNYWQAYIDQAMTYSMMGDRLKNIENLLKAIELIRGRELPQLLGRLSRELFDLKFINLSEHYLQEAYDADNDSASLRLLMQNEETMKRAKYERGKILFVEDIEEAKKMLETNNTLIGGMLYRMAYANSVLGNHTEAFKYWSEYAEIMSEEDRYPISASHRIGYAYWQVGYKDIAREYFDEHLKHCEESIRLNRPYGTSGAYYDLAGYYAFFGEIDKAYGYLEEFIQSRKYFGPSWFKWILFDPMFDEIREEERFQEILYEMEQKDQIEIERVKVWLEENDML